MYGLKTIIFVFSASKIPIISVTVPQNQTVMEGTRRHALTCEVSSTVEITELNITWLFRDQIIAEKLVKKVKTGKHNYLLQCLTEKDLGNYTCIASTTMFDKVWQASETMLLSGNLSGKLTTTGVITKIFMDLNVRITVF